mmetsp:Transcript_23226/g.61010  ORF Transcript_23226/g.61010 Transcript_23226/m.61010 type:complete len:202 (-) Transcript_23226:401-1006(-)
MHSQSVLRSLTQGDAKGRCTTEEFLEVWERQVLINQGCLGEELDQRWCDVGDGDLVKLQVLQVRLRVEAGHGNALGPHPDRVVHHHHHAVDVVKGKDGQERIRGPQANVVSTASALRNVGDDVGVRQHHTLWQTCGTTGIRQSTNVHRGHNRHFGGLGVDFQGLQQSEAVHRLVSQQEDLPQTFVRLLCLRHLRHEGREGH